MNPDELHNLREEIKKSVLDELIAHPTTAPQTLSMIEDLKTMIKDGFQKITDRQDQANHSTAKHNEWINRYDIRVADEIPQVVKQVGDNTKKVYAGIVLLAGLQVVLSFLK